MAICSPILPSELFANLQLIDPTLVERQRLLLVGPDYALRTANVGTGYNFLGDYTATGLSPTAYPNATGLTVDQPSVSVGLSNALVQLFNPDGAAGPYTVANGQQYTGGTHLNKKIVHNATASTGSASDTVWAGAGRSVAVVADVAVGDFVRLFNNSVYFFSRVTAIESSGNNASPTARDVLVLEDALPAGFQGTNYFSVVVCEIVENIAVPASALTNTATTTAIAAITAATARTGTARPVIGGQTNLGAAYSRAFVSYRGLRNNAALTAGVVSIETEADLLALFSAEELADPDSELAFAAARALPPAATETQTAAPVLLTAVATNDLPGYETALQRVQRRRDYAVLVPLSQLTTVISAANSVATFRKSAAVGLWTEVIVSLPINTTSNVVATPAIAITAATNIVTGASVGAFTGVLAGDLFSYAGTDYVISSVDTSQQLTLLTNIGTVGSTLDYSIKRPLTVAQQASDFAARASAYANRALSVVFPDRPVFGGVAVPGYMAAAAVGGLRNYTVPQQSLRGVALPSGWTVPQSESTFVGELETVATGGGFVLAAREDAAGAMVLYPNTTLQTSAATSTEGAVYNIDFLNRHFFDVVNCYTGRWKVNNALIAELTDVLTTEINTLRGQAVGRLGGVLLSGTVGTILIDPANSARLIVPLNLVIASDLGEVALTTSVTLS